MQRAAAPYILILPSFLLAAAIILWPLKEIVSLSLHDVNRFGMLRDFIGLEHFRVLFADPDFIAATWRTLVWTAAVVLRDTDRFRSDRAHPQRGFLRPRHRPHPDHAALGDLADHDRHRLALGAERRKRHAQFGLRGLGLINTNIQWLARPRPRFRCRSSSASWFRCRSPSPSSLAASPPSRTISTRRRRRKGPALGAVPPDHAAAAQALHQYRLRAEHHLRVQFLPDHLGDDAGRARQFHRHPGHLSLQGRLSASASSARPQRSR